MKNAQQTIAELKAKLSMKEEHDQLIDDLKSKAKQFEEFMRNQSPTKSNPLNRVLDGRTNRVRDQCVSTEDLLGIGVQRSSSCASMTNIDRTNEKRIREEMAKAMALKMKTIENQFKSQLDNYEHHLQNLTIELKDMQQALNERESDVINLKKCILSERSEIKTILQQKDFECNEQLHKQHNILV